MKKNESYYQKEFLEFCKSHPFFAASFMSREVPQFYSFDSPDRIKNQFMPFSVSDFIELDSDGYFHLWEAKLLHSDELLKGKVIGQLLFYDFLFQTYPEENIKKLLIENGFDKTTILSMSGEDFYFKTWNILVCGGDGWELCAGVNPIMWNYATLSEQYFNDSTPNLNLFHFYEVSYGFDIKNIWELSIYSPQKLHLEAFSKYLGLDNFPQEDEMEGYYLDFFNIKYGLTDNQIEILMNYNNSEDKKAFLLNTKITIKDIEKINEKFQKSIECLSPSINKEAEERFNSFIGRKWFR